MMKVCMRETKTVLVLLLVLLLTACSKESAVGTTGEQPSEQPFITTASSDPAITGGVVSGEENKPAATPGTGEEQPTPGAGQDKPTVTPEGGAQEVSNLPQLYIMTEGGAAVTSKETYMEGTCTVTAQGYDAACLYEGNLKIRGRGNSTWMTAKKPYRLKLEEKCDLLGLGESKHWVLLANYYDATLMRNRIAFDTARAMNFLAMDSVNVELYLNGEYQGSYQLCEQVRIAKERLAIYDWEKTEEDVAKTLAAEHDELANQSGELEDCLTQNLSWITTGTVSFGGTAYATTGLGVELPALTGGFLIELDDTYDEVSKFRTESGQPIMIKEPEYAYTNEAMFSYIQEYIRAVEDAITSSEHTTEYGGRTVHYRDLIDVDSFVDFFLLTEVFANLDSMFKSTYMYKDINGKLTMGPLWDFDLCAGGSMVIEFSEYYDRWQTTYRSLSTAQGDQWYRYLIRDPEFTELVYQRYRELRPTVFENIIKEGGLIDCYEAALSQCGQNNLAKWGNGSMFGGSWGSGFGGWPGGWGGATTQTTYAQEVATLRTWMQKRLTWLDAQMKDLTTLQNSLS